VTVAALSIEAGIALGRETRLLGYAAGVVAAIVTVHEYFRPGWPAPGAVWTVLPIVALLHYAGAARMMRAYAHSPEARTDLRQVALVSVWIASATVLLFEFRVTTFAYLGLAWAATAMLFTIAGARVGSALRWHGYLTALFAAWVTFVPAMERTAAFNVLALPAVAVLLYASAAIAARTTGSLERTDAERPMHGMLCTAATGLIAVFFWRQVPSPAVAAAWAAFGALLFAVGAWRSQPVFRWHAHVLLGAAAVRIVHAAGTGDGTPFVATVTVAAIQYAVALWSGRSVRGGTPHTGAEESARLAMMIGATALLVFEAARVVDPHAVTATWGLHGLLILAIGFPARERALRLSGLVLLGVCVAKLFLYDLRELEALPRILSFVVLGLVLLGVSWAYTRYRTLISRYL
jgi:hypothetical protein